MPTRRAVGRIEGPTLPGEQRDDPSRVGGERSLGNVGAPILRELPRRVYGIREEHQASNLRVGGSNPSRRAIEFA